MASCSNFNTLNQAEVDYSNLHSLVFTPRYVDGVRVLQQDDKQRYVGVLGLNSLDGKNLIHTDTVQVEQLISGVWRVVSKVTANWKRTGKLNFS